MTEIEKKNKIESVWISGSINEIRCSTNAVKKWKWRFVGWNNGIKKFFAGLIINRRNIYIKWRKAAQINHWPKIWYWYSQSEFD